MKHGDSPMVLAIKTSTNYRFSKPSPSDEQITYGIWIQGYTVRGTLRNPDDPKNAHLGELEGAAERLCAELISLIMRASKKPLTAMMKFFTQHHLSQMI
ncbi:hypothetical protein PS2_002795 [Malus domestica]